MARKVLIQIRRGLETNIGALAVGELGYCEDTQKLYIGTSGGNVLLVAAQTVGDMSKSVYDTNNNGRVDDADKVNGVTVLTAVPANAKFTDTVYVHPSTHPPTIIAQNASNRFVTDAEKETWNAKGGSNLALGETSATAYRGDRGKAAYDHSQSAHAPSNAQRNADITKAEIEAKLTGTIATHDHLVTKSDVGLDNVPNIDTTNAANISSGTMSISRLPRATQAQAVAGTSNSYVMTPLRVKEAIAAHPIGPLTWNDLKGV